MTEEAAPSNAILYARQTEDGIEVCFGPGDHSIKIIKRSNVQALHLAAELIDLVTLRMQK